MTHCDEEILPAFDQPSKQPIEAKLLSTTQRPGMILKPAVLLRVRSYLRTWIYLREPLMVCTFHPIFFQPGRKIDATLDNDRPISFTRACSFWSWDKSHFAPFRSVMFDAWTLIISRNPRVSTRIRPLRSFVFFSLHSHAPSRGRLSWSLGSQGCLHWLLWSVQAVHDGILEVGEFICSKTLFLLQRRK